MLRLRLRPLGRKDRKFYHVVVSNTRDHTTKGSIEVLGYLDPIRKDNQKIHADRISYWLEKGAKVSERVYKFIKNEKAITFPNHILKDFDKIEKSFTKRQNKGVSKKELKDKTEA